MAAIAEPSSSTPWRWRAAALCVLVGGVAVGALAAAGGAGAWLVLGSLIVVAGGLVPVLRGSRRPPLGPDPRPLDPAVAAPTITVLVAGRDEAAVLPTLIEDLAGQDHRDPAGNPRFEVIVIDDRSSDGTSAAVLAAATAAGLAGSVRIIRREGAGLADGKGAALTAAQPATYGGEVVVVLDADARIGPDYLSRVAAYVAAGAPALTARRRILDAAESHLAGAQADEQTQDGELQRGRWASGGCSEFRGNGIALRTDLLARVGGWQPALTEDLDLSSRLASQLGITVAWAIDVEVWEEPVRTWRGLWGQRVRWSEGAIRRVLEHGGAVLASRRLSAWARADFAAYAAQLLAPPLILGALGGALVSGRIGTALALTAVYLAAGGLLGFDALRWESTPDGLPLRISARAARAIRVALFSGIWLGAVPLALWRIATRRGAVPYFKVDHMGSEVLPREPRPASPTVGDP